MKRALFICSRNRLRSSTAEQVFAAWPGVVRNAGVSGVGATGWLAAIPYLVALVCLPLVGRSPDRTGARRLP